MDDLHLWWPDLPAASEATLPVQRWLRGRTWGGGGPLRYERPAAVGVAVSVKAHKVLVETLRVIGENARRVEHEICERLRSGEFKRIQKERKPDEPLTADRYAWPDWLIPEHMHGHTEKTLRLDRDSTTFQARERSLAWCLKHLKAQVELGRRPRLDFTGELPSAMSIRIAAGTAHGRPIHEDGPHAVLGDIGCVRLDDGIGRSLAGCAYVEVAHWTQRWHARFVFTSVNPYSKKKDKTT